MDSIHCLFIHWCCLWTSSLWILERKSWCNLEIADFNHFSTVSNVFELFHWLSQNSTFNTTSLGSPIAANATSGWCHSSHLIGSISIDQRGRKKTICSFSAFIDLLLFYKIQFCIEKNRICIKNVWTETFRVVSFLSYSRKKDAEQKSMCLMQCWKYLISSYKRNTDSIWMGYDWISYGIQVHGKSAPRKNASH